MEVMRASDMRCVSQVGEGADVFDSAMHVCQKFSPCSVLFFLCLLILFCSSSPFVVMSYRLQRSASLNKKVSTLTLLCIVSYLQCTATGFGC